MITEKIFIMALLFVQSILGFAAEALVIKNSWVREAPPMAKKLAGYGELRNMGNQPLTIVTLNSPMFHKVQMHVSTFVDGMMRMKHIESLRLKPGELVLFEPSGKHFMLIRPKQQIKVGLKVPFEFTLKSGKKIFAEFDVRR